MKLSKGRSSGSKRLIDRIATQRITKIQGSERRAGVTKAMQADDQFGGNLPSGELIAWLGPTLVLEAAGDARNPNLGPEGHPSGGRAHEDGVQVPAHDCLDPRPDRVAGSWLGVHAWQHRLQVAIADQPFDCADELGMITANDDTLGAK